MRTESNLSKKIYFETLFDGNMRQINEIINFH